VGTLLFITGEFDGGNLDVKGIHVLHEWYSAGDFRIANHGFVASLAWSSGRVTKWKPRKSNVAPARSIAQVKTAIPMPFRTQNNHSVSWFTHSVSWFGFFACG